MPTAFHNLTLTDEEFAHFRRFIFNEAGIDIPATKRGLVQARLAKRLRTLNLPSYKAYWHWIQDPCNRGEWQRAVNQLTTNETYFFREPDHFHWLQHWLTHHPPHPDRPLRIWSAASSTGEEPYTIAMVLAEVMGLSGNWQLFGTDINTRVTAFARRAVYPLGRVNKTPLQFWQRYFQRGHDEYAEHVRVRPDLVRRVHFANVNLLNSLAWEESSFDIVFLRNVLIYFNESTKRQVLEQLCAKIRPGGHLLIGHSEVIRMPDLPLKSEGPSRYRIVRHHAHA